MPTSKREIGRSVCMGEAGPLQAGSVVRGRQLVAPIDSGNSRFTALPSLLVWQVSNQSPESPFELSEMHLFLR